jgi:hypothetical protein
MCSVVDSRRKKKKKKKTIPVNKFDKFRESKGKIVYYGTQAKKECTFALICVHLWVGVLCAF